MKTYSMDLRERVFADCQAGMSTGEAAAKYSVSPAWVRRLKQRQREGGTIAARRPTRKKPRWAADADRLREEVSKTPDATLLELRERLGLSYSVPTLCRALQALKLTIKKKLLGPPSRIGPM